MTCKKATGRGKGKLKWKKQRSREPQVEDTQTKESEKLTSDSHCDDDVRLQGVSICPGIGIGRIRKVDLDIPIPQDNLDLSGIAAEQDRYSRAVETARRHLPEHVATVHGDPLPEAKAIFGVHQAILAGESLHSKVRNRIAAEWKRPEFSYETTPAPRKNGLFTAHPDGAIACHSPPAGNSPAGSDSRKATKSSTWSSSRWLVTPWRSLAL